VTKIVNSNGRSKIDVRARRSEDGDGDDYAARECSPSPDSY